MRLRQTAATATPRAVLTPRRGGNNESAVSGACRWAAAVPNKVCNSVCGATKEVWGGFKDIFTRRQLSRRDQARRTKVLRAILFILFIAFFYYTYMYKFVYYRQAYSYAQGYADAARDFVNKKISK